MKGLVYYLLGLLLLCTSCDVGSAGKIASKIGEQLSYLNKMSGEFGGAWTGSSGGDCYYIEITNSERINDNPDSLDFFGTFIGREFKEDIESNYSCLTLKLVQKTKTFIFWSSTGREVSYDLNLIHRFKEREIPEFLTIKKALAVCQNADYNNLEKAEEGFSQLDTSLKNPFIDLAEAHLDRAYGREEESTKKMMALVNAPTSDDLLIQYLATYYWNGNELEEALGLFKRAHEMKPNSIEHLSDVGVAFLNLNQLDSSTVYFSKIIDRDSLNIQAIYHRAESRFLQERENLGCQDLRRILRINSRVELPDSLLNRCGIQK